MAFFRIFPTIELGWTIKWNLANDNIRVTTSQQIAIFVDKMVQFSTLKSDF